MGGGGNAKRPRHSAIGPQTLAMSGWIAAASLFVLIMPQTEVVAFTDDRTNAQLTYWRAAIKVADSICGGLEWRLSTKSAWLFTTYRGSSRLK